MQRVGMYRADQPVRSGSDPRFILYSVLVFSSESSGTRLN